MHKDQKLGWYLEDFKVGQRFVSWTRKVTETDLVNFGCLTGDFYPLHFDEAYAKEQGFKGRIMHGMSILSFGGGFAHHSLPIEGRAIAHLAGEYKFMAPLYPGDSLYSEFEIIEVRPSKTKPDRGILAWKHWFKNQRDEVVAESIVRFMYRRRPAGEAKAK